MSRVLYFDCFSGISGDMVLGAFLDAGLPLDELKRALGSLSVSGFDVSTARVRLSFPSFKYQRGEYDACHPAMPEVKADSSVDLLLKAQSGDGEALNRLLARYLPRLQRWASGRLPAGVRTMLDTGDLVQDAIINALRHLDSLEVRTEGALQAYLRRAIHNRIIDLYRRAGRRPAREEIPEGAVAAGMSPLEAAIGAEALDGYERALARLKDDDRQAIVLRVELGLDYEEMATQLGKPSAAAARMAVTRAIARLAEEMRRAR